MDCFSNTFPDPYPFRYKSWLMHCVVVAPDYPLPHASLTMATKCVTYYASRTLPPKVLLGTQREPVVFFFLNKKLQRTKKTIEIRKKLRRLRRPKTTNGFFKIRNYKIINRKQ